MIDRIHIQRYKSLRDVDVRLKPLSVLLGPNAAGKSNFIDALQLLSRIAGSRSLKEAFDPPYRGKPLESFSFDSGGIEGLMKRDSASFSIEVDLTLSPMVITAVDREIGELKRGSSNGADPAAKKSTFIHHKNLRYRIEVEIVPNTGVLRVADEDLVALGADGIPKSKPRPFLERVNDRIGRIGVRGGHREGAEPGNSGDERAVVWFVSEGDEGNAERLEIPTREGSLTSTVS